MTALPRSPRLRRTRLSEQLTAQLRRHIQEHRLRPGDPLLTEQEMMDRFGVSRSVVREATKALDFLGIIDTVPSRGMVLDQFDFGRVCDYFGFHLALSDYPREQLFQARMVVELGSLSYTIEAIRRRPELADELRRLAEAAPESDQRETWTEYDIAFHRRLVEASGIAPLNSFSDLLRAFFRESLQELAVSRKTKDHHVGIVEALRQGDLATATTLLRSHTRWLPQETRS